MVQDMDNVLILYMVSYLSLFVEKAILFSPELLLNLCQKSVVHIYVGLFLGSLFGSISTV